MIRVWDYVFASHVEVCTQVYFATLCDALFLRRAIERGDSCRTTARFTLALQCTSVIFIALWLRQQWCEKLIGQTQNDPPRSDPTGPQWIHLIDPCEKQAHLPDGRKAHWSNAKRSSAK